MRRNVIGNDVSLPDNRRRLSANCQSGAGNQSEDTCLAAQATCSRATRRWADTYNPSTLCKGHAFPVLGQEPQTALNQPSRRQWIRVLLSGASTTQHVQTPERQCRVQKPIQTVRIWSFSQLFPSFLAYAKRFSEGIPMQKLTLFAKQYGGRLLIELAQYHSWLFPVRDGSQRFKGIANRTALPDVNCHLSAPRLQCRPIWNGNTWDSPPFRTFWSRLSGR